MEKKPSSPFSFLFNRLNKKGSGVSRRWKLKSTAGLRLKRRFNLHLWFVDGILEKQKLKSISGSSMVQPPTCASPASLVLPHKQVQENHVFVSKLPTIPIDNHIPLHTYCFENCSQYPDRTCLIMGNTGKSYTFVETHLICRRVAASLARIGVGKGDVVMALLQNCAEFVFTFMGASTIGAVTTTVNPFCTTTEIFKQFKASRSKIIVMQTPYMDKLRDTGDDSNHI